MLGLGRVIGVLFAASVLLGISLAVGASATPISGVHPGVTASSLTTAPVYIHFKPKSVTAPQGGKVTIKGVVENKGGFSFVATSCILWFRLGTSGSWTRAGVCLNPTDFPVTFAAHSNTSASETQKVSKTFPTGVYEWKIELIGTYHGANEKSHLGKLKVTIT
jgi:hypothetical protein